MVSTPLRALRIPDDVWLPLVKIAEANGTTATAVMLKAAKAYIKADKS